MKSRFEVGQTVRICQVGEILLPEKVAQRRCFHFQLPILAGTLGAFQKTSLLLLLSLVDFAKYVSEINYKGARSVSFNQEICYRELDQRILERGVK